MDDHRFFPEPGAAHTPAAPAENPAPAHKPAAAPAAPATPEPPAPRPRPCPALEPEQVAAELNRFKYQMGAYHVKLQAMVRELDAVRPAGRFNTIVGRVTLTDLRLCLNLAEQIAHRHAELKDHILRIGQAVERRML